MWNATSKSDVEPKSNFQLFHKQWSWKRSCLPFDFTCNIGQFTQLLNFWLSYRLVLLWKWNNNYSKTIQCKELLRKITETWQFMTKKYFKNELKHSKRFNHVTDDVMSLFWSNYEVEHYFPANCLCRMIKGWISTAFGLGLVSRLFRSRSLPP